MGQLWAHSSEPRKLHRLILQQKRLGPPWILRSGYPKLSSCRDCTVGEIRWLQPRELKMVPTCTDYRDVPWGHQASSGVHGASFWNYMAFLETGHSLRRKVIQRQEPPSGPKPAPKSLQLQRAGCLYLLLGHKPWKEDTRAHLPRQVRMVLHSIHI